MYAFESPAHSPHDYLLLIPHPASCIYLTRLAMKLKVCVSFCFKICGTPT